jgi:hypothetical protein
MAETQSCPLNIPTSVAAGGSMNVDHLIDKRVIVSTAVFVATVKLQGSLDETVWHDLILALGPGNDLPIASQWRFLRANTTAYTSGTPAATVVGTSQS